MLTIFTPTYNRKDKLKNLYNSLLMQNYLDFEWVVVDDGSTDGTKEYIESIKKENKIEIIYFYQENKGKSMAHNKGVELSSKDFFVCIDSDDILVENILHDIVKKCSEIKEKEDIAAVAYLNAELNSKKIVGTTFPDDIKTASYYDIYNKYNVIGDKKFVFKKDVIKNYPFPHFEKEKFVPEALVYNRIAKKYNFLLINTVISLVEYLNDGYSSNYFELVKKNPNGNMLYYKELYELDSRLYNVAAYNMYGIYAKKKFLDIIKGHPSKFKAILMYIPAYIKYIKKEKQHNK